MKYAVGVVREDDVEVTFAVPGLLVLEPELRGCRSPSTTDRVGWGVCGGKMDG
jgi:hypothetical protein